MKRQATITAPKRYEAFLDKNCRASAGPKPSISGMKKLYWGENAPTIKCGQYLYLVTQEQYDNIKNSI